MTRADGAGGEDLSPEEVEVLDGLPVLEGGEAVRVRRLVPAERRTKALAGERRAAAAAAVQAAAAAAGGFMAGAAVIRLVDRRRRAAIAPSRGRRGAVRRARGGSAAGELVQIVGSRSLLLDVHLLAGPGKDS